MNIAIVPIRDDSTRLKNKATGFYLWEEYTPLHCMVERLRLSQKLDKIIFIIPDTPENDNICNIIDQYTEYEGWNFSYFKGSINDLSGKALKAINYSTFNKEDLIINITGDCPLIDPSMIDYLISKYIYIGSISLENGVFSKDIFVSNVLTRSWPDGFDIQIYRSEKLNEVYPIAIDKKKNTQLGWDIVNYSGILSQYNIILSMYNFPASEEYFYPDWGLTLDYKEDIEVISNIYNHFKNFTFTAEQVIDYLKKNPQILEINKKCRRNIPGS